jgi:hypothetical protein
MIRKLKALSLALGVVFALGAVMASSASATDLFTNAAKTGNDILTGVSHDNVFSVAGGNGKFECTTSRFAGTATHGKSTVTVEPEYFGTPLKAHTATEHCRGNASDKVVVDMNECDYEINGETTGKDITDPSGGKTLYGTVWIKCPVGKEITITDTTTGVTLHIHEQTPTEGGVTFTNTPTHTGGEAISLKITVTGITYTCTPTFTCGLGGISSEANDGHYSGTLTTTCFKDEDTSGHHKKDGAQTGCSIS